MNDILLTPIRLKELEALIENSVRKVLCESHKVVPQAEPDRFLNITQAAALVNLAVATLYTLVSRKQIPCMKRSGRLYFSKAQLIDWIESGKKKTLTEIQAEVIQSLDGHKNKQR